MGTDIHYKFHQKKNDNWEEVNFYIPISRHYLLFSVLADVRNGFGFAGVKTYDPVNIISPPRGLPLDIKTDTEEDYDYGDHSYSWLTSSEILDFFKQQENTTGTGIMDKDVFLSWDGISRPSDYYGGVAGRDVKILHLPYDLEQYQKDPQDYTHFQGVWDINVFSDLEYFKNSIKEHHDKYGEFRMTFGFDS